MGRLIGIVLVLSFDFVELDVMFRLGLFWWILKFVWLLVIFRGVGVLGSVIVLLILLMVIVL